MLTDPREFTRPIRFLRCSEELDERGQSTEVYVRFASRTAKIQQMSGLELERARAIWSQATYEIRCRHVRGLSTRDRILYRGRTFEIGSINDIDLRGEEDLILATEVR